MQALKQIHTVIYILFLLCYAYQLIYIPIALLAKRKKKPKAQLQEPTHSFAVLIAARNEEGVLPDLLRSIRSQNYPQELIRTCVIADNCTDGTAFAARRCGARVYIRNALSRIGKGYALSELPRRIRTRARRSIPAPAGRCRATRSGSDRVCAPPPGVCA